MIFNSQGDAKLRTYINGGSITPGSEAITLPKGGQLLGDLTIAAVQTEQAIITPTAQQQIIIPPAGKYFSQVNIEGDANLIPDNIAEGIEIFGILGTFAGGLSGEVIKYTTSANTQNFSIEHHLGVIPSMFFILGNFTTNDEIKLIFYPEYYKASSSATTVTKRAVQSYVYGSMTNGTGYSYTTPTLTENSISFKAGGGGHFYKGREYTVIILK